MSYALSFSLSLGSSQTGLTLSAQLVDTAGADVGSPIVSGFAELGRGNYLWTYTAVPDGFQGGVVFSSNAEIKAVGAINPQDTPVMVDGKTHAEALQIIAAMVAGKLSGSQTNTEIFVGLDGVTVRATVTVDSQGNRSNVVYG